MAGRKSTDADQRIGQRLRLLRQTRAISQEHLGEAVGISFQQIQKYERGTNRVSAARLLQLAAALGVPIETFYEGLTAKRADHTPRHIGEPKMTAEGRRLILAFMSITDAKKRKQILAFVQSVAEK